MTMVESYKVAGRDEETRFHRDGRVTSGGELVGRWLGPDRHALSARWVFKAWDGAVSHARTRDGLRRAISSAWCRTRTSPR